MKLKVLIILAVLVGISLSGCFVKVSSTPVGSSAGIFASQDSGDTWTNISRLLSLESGDNFAGASILSLEFDPQVSSTIYAGTSSDGIFFTLDSGRSWSQTLADAGQINDIAVQPDDKCMIFAATNDQLFRSVDCARTWQPLLLELRNDSALTAIAIDDSEQTIIYAATNIGGLYRSSDRGESWQVVNFFETDLQDLIIDPDNYNNLYLGSSQQGILRSLDRGKTWINIVSDLEKEYRGINIYHDLVIAPSDGKLFYSNDNGIFVSANQGRTWRALSLLTAPRAVYIYGLGVSYFDSNKIYYSTSDTFYRSSDGGENWTTRFSPTSHLLGLIYSSPVTDGLLYVGIRKGK
jgi:photosystem II stability/assembly factor-like uncharacterized protein